MLEGFKDMVKKIVAKLKKEKHRGPIRSGGRPRKDSVAAVTDDIDMEEEVVSKSSLKKSCASYEEHNCLALQLTNNDISVLEEIERTFKHIGDHPTLSEDSKSDIQHCLNKIMIMQISSMAPAFPLMVNYPRKKELEVILKKALRKGAPGVIEYKKHI